MKQILITLLTFWMIGGLFAQVPQAFSYQGIARDAAANPIVNQTIGLRLSILKNSPTGISVYTETHQTSTTALGLFNLKVGKGTASSNTFTDLDWSSGRHYLQIELDERGGTNYKLIGTNELLSVPYALHSGNGSKWGDLENGIIYEEGQVRIENNDTQNNKAALWIKTARSSSYSDGMHGLVSQIEAGRDYTFAIRGISLTETPSNNGRSYGVRAEAGNATPGANYGVYGMLRGENSGAAILGHDRITHSSWSELIPRNRSWAGFFYGGVHIKDKLGLGTTEPNAKLQISDGDIYIEDINKGVIMKSPSGDCWRMSVSDAGEAVFTAIDCP